MKRFLPLAITCFFLYFLLPSVFCQQNATNPTKSVAASPWKPMKIKSDGKNSIDGVEFFRKPSDCNSLQYVFIRLVNSNNYPVKVKWSGSDGHENYVIVDPLSEIEGNCQSQKQLTFQKDKGENGKLKRQLLSSLEIIAVKN